MAMNLGERKGIVSDINITPMIDILLVLIIVFMVIHTATKATGLDAMIPHPAEPPGKISEGRTVVVELTPQGVDRPLLFINHQPVQWEALRARLIEIYKWRAERVLFVKADHSLEFEPVATVIDTARGAFPDMKVGLIP